MVNYNVQSSEKYDTWSYFAQTYCIAIMLSMILRLPACEVLPPGKPLFLVSEPFEKGQSIKKEPFFVSGIRTL